MISTYLQEISASIGLSGSEPSLDSPLRHVTVVEIDRIRRPVASTFITVGYVNGYEVFSWKENSLDLVCSFTGSEAVNLMRILPSLRNMAMVLRSSPSVVRFVDLTSNDSYHLIRMTSAVISIRASLSALVVSVQDRIHVFNPDSLEETFSTACSSSSLLALADRWVAYNVTPQKSSAAPLMGQMWGKLSTIGQDAFDNIVMAVSATTEDAQSLQSPVKIVRENRNGLVAVRDVLSFKVIATVEEKNSRPVEHIEWSNCGSLLMTTSGNGHQIFVYEALGREEEIRFELRNILNRGLTPALISSMSIDSYSRFAAVSSNKGTVHVFPLSCEEGADRKLKPTDLETESRAFFDWAGNLLVLCKSRFTAYRVGTDIEVLHSAPIGRPAAGSSNMSLTLTCRPERSQQQVPVDVKTCPDPDLPLWLSPQLSFWVREADGQVKQVKGSPAGAGKIYMNPDLDLDEYSKAVDSALSTPLIEDPPTAASNQSYFKDGFVQIIHS